MYNFVFVRITLILGVLLLGAACTPVMNVDVVRYHAAEPFEHQTFKLVPLAEENREGPEFKFFADQVSSQLMALGYEENDDSADITIKIDYDIKEAEVNFSYPFWSHAYYYGITPGFGRFYGAEFALGWRYPGRGYPLWGYYGYPYDVAIYDLPYNSRLPRFDRVFEMVMFDESETAIFEGRVVSRGRSSDLGEVFPFLVKAMFTSFPGESGKSERFSFNLDDGTLIP